MHRVAEFVLRHRRWVIVAWILITIFGVAIVQKTNNRLVIDFSLPGQPGTQTANQIDSEFHAGGKTQPYILTVTMPPGETLSGHSAEVAKTFDAVAQLPEIRVLDEANTGDPAFRTKDNRTAYAMAWYRFSHSPTFTLPTDSIKAAMTKAAAPGQTIGATGWDALSVGSSGGSGGVGVLGEVLLGALGALAVLAFVFASFLAFLPLVVAAVSILTTFIFLLPLTYLTNVSFIVEFLVALIGLGIAIDYSLILVTRWREERDHGRDNHDAVVVAMETAGRAVVFSGFTVAIGLLALLVLPVPFMRSIGIGGALIPLASVIVTLTLTPAILGGIGPRVDWPRLRHENTASKSWSRWAGMIVRHRVIAAIAAFVVLGALFVSFLGIRIGMSSSESLVKEGSAYNTLQVLKNGGITTGVLTPMEVLVKTPQAASVAKRIDSVDGVLRTNIGTGPGQTANGNSIIVVIPKEETVNSKTIGVVRRVKDAVDDQPGVIGVAGVGADQIDFLKAVYGNFPLMLLVIAVLTFILLARAFQSVVLPIKAVVLNLITLSATLGFMVAFWQFGHGSSLIFGVDSTGAVTFWVPLMVFAFLYGLSMDYEVFILSRIKEEYAKDGNTDTAVIEGIGRTGRLVTSAALILFLAFVALSSGPGTDLKVFASALGFGILLDATIVRSVLVPALVSMFGRWNWYMPQWLAKVLRVHPIPAPEPALSD